MGINLKPTRAKGSSTIGVGHDGKRKEIAPEGAAPAYDVAHASHGTAASQFGPEAHGGKKNIARSSSTGKHVHQVAFHQGMTEQQRYFAGGGGVPSKHGGVPGCDPSMPDDLTVGKAKQLSAPKITPGMRNRTSNVDLVELGKAILSQATRTR